MGKKYFDKNIKNKLEELEIKYDASSWDTFEKKLDNAMNDSHIEDLAFDEQIKDKIQNDIHHPFEEEHWQELSSRIDYENELTNRIYLLKIVELAILVLLAYGFFQIEPIKKSQKKLPLYAHSEIFNRIEGDKVIEAALTNAATNQDNLRKELVNSVFVSTEEIATLKSVVFTNKLIADAHVNSESVYEDREVHLAMLGNQDIAALHIDERQPFRETINLDALTVEEDSDDFPLPPAFVKPDSEKWISFSGSADINLVNTPKSFLINAREQLLNAAGFSSRLSYGAKTGKNEVEIGVGYSYKNYDPDIREEFDVDGESIYSYSLNRIEFHIAQVSFNYKRYIVDNSNWSVFADVGLSPNFILFSDFDTPGKLQSGPATTNEFIKANSRLLSRNYPTGLLQNVGQPSFKRSSSKAFRTEGDIYDNTFITTYLGFGVQKYIGFNRALFLQTGYHHQFLGDKLGPNKDQINTFSFTLGGKFRI